jgi:septum formation protein
MGKRLVLASTSQHRRALLDRLGVPYEALAPRCDEAVAGVVAPEDLVRLLSRRKAESLGSEVPDALVVGSDQVVEVEGEVLGKPGSPERALDQLLRLAGREHRLLTGLCVHDPETGRSEVALDVHRMQMWPLSREQLARYVEWDRPVDCSGAYRVEAAGALLFERMAGEDHTAIVGLPVTLLAGLLRRFGVTLLDLVAARDQ